MSFYICSNCGFGSGSWLGRCPDCGEFNTLVDKPAFSRPGRDSEGEKESIKKLELTSFKKILPADRQVKLKTGFFEFDRVLGGGIIPGEVIFLSGEPGVGKSTLLLQILSKLQTIYISGEEAAEQVKERTERLNISIDNFLFSSDTQIEGIVEGLEEIKDKIEIVVIDSIQTMYSNTVNSPAGTISQLKECAAKLIAFAKKNKTAVILIGHITKGGEIAGPKTLEHAVDCVLNFEGEKVSNYRILRTSKNRFGGTDEVGIFEMLKTGLKEVSDPLIFIENKDQVEIGKAVIGVSEGKRSLFFEIQTLVVPTVLAIPRRVVNGVDYNKVLLLLAVLRKYLNIPFDKFDIYVNVVGGVEIKSTASDLGIIASLISSVKNIPLPKKSVFIGEVGLLGEVRKVYFEEKIIKETQRLGFKNIYSRNNVNNIKQLKSLLNR